MLDTDICIYLIKNNNSDLNERYLTEIAAGNKLCISWVNYLELVYGIEKSASKKANRENLETFLQEIIVEPIGTQNKSLIDNYASTRITLEKAGEPLDQLYLLIGAHALTLQATLVTNNTKHFKRIPGLVLENWTQ